MGQSPARADSPCPSVQLASEIAMTRSMVTIVALALLLLLTGCNSGSTTGGGGGTQPVAPSITTQPASQAVGVGQTASFSVVAAGTAPLSYQWQKKDSNIYGPTSGSYTTPATASSDNGSTFRVVITNAAGNIASNEATLTVNAGQTAGVDVTTYKNN